MVAILIPTKNRPDYIIRQLRYYKAAKSQHSVYIGDASDSTNFEILENFLKNNKFEFKISHLALKNVSTLDTQIVMAETANEEYVCFCGDDDFQIPSAVQMCEDFLRQNDQYSTASGKAILFSINSNSNVYGKIHSIDHYPANAYEDNSAAERVQDQMNRFSIVFYGVTRRKQYLNNFSKGKGLLDKTITDELLPNFLFSAQGKTKIFPFLGFAREGLPAEKKYALPPVIDWILGKNFHTAVNKLIEFVSAEISAVDHISIEDATIITKNSFLNYLSKVLSKKPSLNKNRSLKGRIKKLTSIKSVLTKINYLIDQNRKRFPNGIYYWIKMYPDFQLIYATIVDAAGQFKSTR